MVWGGLQRVQYNDGLYRTILFGVYLLRLSLDLLGEDNKWRDVIACYLTRTS